MGSKKWTEDYFSKRLKTERERRKWSQAEMAKMLRDNGIQPMHWTTVAKIEKGERSVRIDEAAGIADLFGISVDTLLGRRAKPKSDLVHTLTAVADTAYRSSAQIGEIITAVRDRITDVSAFEDNLPVRDTLIAGCERAYAALVAADGALVDTAQIAREGMGGELKATR
jgi:transcriptional regulator with XRE-family HTH domain